MVQITGQKNGVVWDAERDCPLATFKEGTFQTEDPSVAEKLESMGYVVVGEFKMPDPLAAMSVKELQIYAEEKNIDLADNRKKADILALIKAAEVANGGEK